ncbi:MAG: DsbA family protein [Patescibacteria group bacterium]
MNWEKLSIPIAIIGAGLILGAAVYFQPQFSPTEDNLAAVGDLDQSDISLENVRPLTTEDNIKGSLEAPIIIIEYSDPDCSFCHRFHNTLKEIVDLYDDNQVAWVYRHFNVFGSASAQKSIAFECAGELENNSGFWSYLEAFHQGIDQNNKAGNVDELTSLAGDIGLDTADFRECLESERPKNVIETDTDNAIASGGSGTPFSLIKLPSGEIVELGGAVPTENLIEIIDELLEAPEE